MTQAWVLLRDCLRPPRAPARNCDLLPPWTLLAGIVGGGEKTRQFVRDTLLPELVVGGDDPAVRTDKEERGPEVISHFLYWS
jgi:hypothetical protein